MRGRGRMRAAGMARLGEALRGAAPAALAAVAVLGGVDVALATTDTTFGSPLDTVEGIVGGTGGQLAAALAVGAALVGSVLRFNAMQLMGDRIAKVVRAPDGFAVEHDGASGDLYLRPAHPSPSAEAAGHEPVTLFVGTERGFTYRLTLTPSDRDSAQILIRNVDAAVALAAKGPVLVDDPHLAALVGLVRAVARRETLPGYAIARGEGVAPDGMTFIETWRGPRFAAHVLEADRDAPEAAGLAGTIGSLPGAGRMAALWLAAPGTGPSGGRLVVAVTDAAGDRR